MDRRIEPPVQAPRRCARRRCARGGRGAGAADVGGCSARVRAAHDRGPDRGARPVGPRGRGAGDAQPRGAPERHAVADGHPLHHRAGPVVDPPHLRAGNRCSACAPARPGAPGAVVCHPERRQAARHHPAPLDDQPRDDGRPLVEGHLADRDGDSGAVDDPAGAPRRAGRRERLDLGPARAPAPGAGRPRAAAGQPRERGSDHRDDRQRHVGVAADLPPGVDSRVGRLDRHAPAAARGASHLPDRVGRRPVEGDGRRRGSAAP